MPRKGYLVDETAVLDAAVPGALQLVAYWYIALREAAKSAVRLFRRKRPPALPEGAGFQPWPRERMRVLFCSTDNDSASGAFLCMVELAKGLEERHGIEVLVVLPYGGSGTKLLEEAKIAHCYVPSADWNMYLGENPRSFKTAVSIVWRVMMNHKAIAHLESIIRLFEPAAVHVNTSWGYAGALAAKRAGVPVVWHMREFLEEDQGRTPWNRPAANAAIAGADCVAAVSDAVRDKYSAWVAPEKLVRIYDGADLARFYKPEKNIFAGETATFIMVGGVCHHKGHPDLVRACAKLYGEGVRNFRVWFVGGEAPSARRECDEIIRQARMEGVFSFLGRKSDPESYLEKADVAFVCSRCEAFGRVTVEAMLSGCLVIGADTGGSAELVKDGETGLAYHYSEERVENLAAKIRQALADPAKMRRIAAQGRAEMAENMAFGRNVDEFAAIYRRLSAKNRVQA